jgi:hypothetical protein
MALQDTDLLLVNRGGTNYKVIGEDVKEYVYNPAGGIKWEPFTLPGTASFTTDDWRIWSIGNQSVDINATTMCIRLNGGVGRTNNGTDWTFHDVPGDANLMAYTGGGIWYTTGTGGYFVSKDDGITWALVSTTPPAGTWAGNPWTVQGGSEISIPIITDPGGAVNLTGAHVSTDGGDSWTQKSYTPTSLGIISAAQNVGIQWNCSRGSDGVGAYVLTGTYTIDGVTYFLVGRKTTDGGASWIPGQIGGSNQARFYNLQRAYIGGGLTFTVSQQYELPLVYDNGGFLMDAEASGLLYGPRVGGTSGNPVLLTGYSPEVSGYMVGSSVTYNSYPQPSGTPAITQAVGGGLSPIRSFRGRIYIFTSATGGVRQA